MQLDLTEDQAALPRDHAPVRRDASCRSRAPRALHDDPVGFDREWLRKAADLGWFAMLVPEAARRGQRQRQRAARRRHRRGATRPPRAARTVRPDERRGRRDRRRTAPTRLQAEVLPGSSAGDAVATWAFADAAGRHRRRSGRASPRRDGRRPAPHRDAGLRPGRAVGRPPPRRRRRSTGSRCRSSFRRTAAGLRVRPLDCLDLSRRFAHVDLDGVRGRAADAVLGRRSRRARAPAAGRRSPWTWPRPSVRWTPCSTMTVELRQGPHRVRPAHRLVPGASSTSSPTRRSTSRRRKAGAAAAANAVAATAADGAAEVVAHGRRLRRRRAATSSPRSASRSTAGSATRGSTTCTCCMRRIRSNAALYGEPTWHRERVCALHRLGAGGGGMTDVDVRPRRVPGRGPGLARRRTCPQPRGPDAAGARHHPGRSSPPTGRCSRQMYEAGYVGITVADRVRRPGPARARTSGSGARRRPATPCRCPAGIATRRHPGDRAADAARSTPARSRSGRGSRRS